MKTSYHTSPSGHKIAYLHVGGDAPGVFFLPGFHSDMRSTKAQALMAHCMEQNIAFTTLDYFAHGESEGDFLEFTLSKALDDIREIITHVAHGPQIVVGSSMGGWLMMLTAIHHPEHVAGLVGIASAPDFTERLMYEQFSPEEHETFRNDGVLYVPSEYSLEGYPITDALITDGRTHMLLDDAIRIEKPVHLIHGQLDVDVPWQFSLKAAEKMLGSEVVITLIKDGEHRLSRPDDLATIIAAVNRMRDLTNR